MMQYKLKKNKIIILAVFLIALLALGYVFFSGAWVYPLARYFNLVDAFSGREYILLMGTDAGMGKKFYERIP
ncbi:MAG: hypothetical protein MJ157_01850 [Clostridia bacterium]|nr:hypothetical protein [Clostridia bacterium]